MKKHSLIEKIDHLVEFLEYDPIGQHGMIVALAKEIRNEHLYGDSSQNKVDSRKSSISMPDQKRHDEGWEKHLQEWQALEERKDYRKNNILPLRNRLIELCEIKDKSIEVWTEIRRIKEELKFIPEDLFNDDDKGKGRYISNFEASNLRRLASYIHLYKCKSKIHTEDCGWFYEDNDNDKLHKKYLTMTEAIVAAGVDTYKLIDTFKNYYLDNTIDTTFIDEALSRID